MPHLLCDSDPSTPPPLTYHPPLPSPFSIPCRKRFVEALRTEFAHLDLTFSIGGQISFDVFPRVRLQAAPLLTAPLSRRQRG